MIKEHNRARRIAQEIKKNIAIILQRYIKNLPVDMTTVSSVEVSRDLIYAKVFITFLRDKDNEQIKYNIKILQNSAGFISSLLGKVMYLRVIPKLIFIYDDSLAKGINITKLINQVK